MRLCAFTKLLRFSAWPTYMRCISWLTIIDDDIFMLCFIYQHDFYALFTMFQNPMRYYLYNIKQAQTVKYTILFTNFLFLSFVQTQNLLCTQRTDEYSTAGCYKESAIAVTKSYGYLDLVVIYSFLRCISLDSCYICETTLYMYNVT